VVKTAVQPRAVTLIGAPIGRRLPQGVPDGARGAASGVPCDRNTTDHTPAV
jgi:hypothetical protein